MRRKFAVPAFLLLTIPLSAQISRLGENLTYSAEISGTVSSGDIAPFWLSSNKYGLSSIDQNSGYIRGGVFRNIESDSHRNWKVGYGMELAVPVNYTSDFVVHQLYTDIQYRLIRLGIGSKERPMELKNNELSSGGLTNSINSRPIPQVRLELPDFWSIPGTQGWLAVKGHVAYGMFTDNNWQKDFTQGKSLYTANSLYHSKAGYLKIGNEKKFPLTFTGGLEMATQFGGEAWNVAKRPDDTSDFTGGHITMGNGIKDFWNAFIPGGSDATDGNYANIEGNHLGSWLFSAKYHGKGWSLHAYAEHFFEDHSQMFFQYGWKDMMWGLEAKLPDNAIVSTVLYEYLTTKDQTGGLYHDETQLLPIQISGVDNYYNHSIYGGWHHWGQAIGNPLLLSPVYNTNAQIKFLHNRITAHHLGISGDPCRELHYRLMFSHTKSLGTYVYPLAGPKHANYFMLELTYSPLKLKGWSFAGAFATNGGNLVEHSTGGAITVRKSGILNL